jgi:hypothetical protein
MQIMESMVLVFGWCDCDTTADASLFLCLLTCDGFLLVDHRG